jgi:hypothetical protein
MLARMNSSAQRASLPSAVGREAANGQSSPRTATDFADFVHPHYHGTQVMPSLLADLALRQWKLQPSSPVAAR